MRFDVHVCLVSDQPTPNFIPVLAKEFRPQEVILVVTPKMQKNADALGKVMEQRCGVKVQQLSIDNEYDTAKIGERLFELLLNVDKEKVALNVTGGTKLMAIGAYSTFRDAGYPSFYVSGKTGEIQILDSDESITFEEPKIRIEDYLALHGYAVLEGQAKRELDKKWFPIAEELIRSYRSLSGALGVLNAAISEAKNKQADALEINLRQVDQNMDYLLSKLEEYGLAESREKNVRFTSVAARNYLAGTWFEEYVFHTIKNLQGIQDCALGVQIDLADGQQRSRNELDVAFMAKNGLHVVECKTANFDADNMDNARRNEPLYKLESLKKLGGLRTKTALISYRALGQKCGHMKARADGVDIRIFEQKDLQGLKKLLDKWINPEGKL